VSGGPNQERKLRALSAFELMSFLWLFLSVFQVCFIEEGEEVRPKHEILDGVSEHCSLETKDNVAIKLIDIFLTYPFLSNPGSWAWLTEDRPYPNATCADPDQWIYGIGGNQTKVSKYARKDVIANKQAVIDRYRGRNVHYALGLLDDGPGDTHCQVRIESSGRGRESISSYSFFFSNDRPSCKEEITWTGEPNSSRCLVE